MRRYKEQVNAPRVIAYPKGGIAYNEGFYRAVERLGVTVIDGIQSGRWLLETVRRGDWVHLHWPSFGYSAKGGGIRLTLFFVRYLLLLLTVRLKGGKLVWTAHNLLPHKCSGIPSLDIVVRRFVIALSSLVMVHGPEAARILTARFPAVLPKIILIPHGHWIGYYPMTTTRAQARDKLGIAHSKFVYLFIGLCAPYKNLDGLIEAFRSVEGEGVLLVAGKFQDPDYEHRILGLAEKDSRIRIHSGFIPGDEMQTYLLACDVVVVPYREILTSGTAMLAMSFGRPVVSVKIGFLRDVVSKEVGLLFSANDQDELVRALREVRELDFDEAQVIDHARQYSFEDAAHIFLRAIFSKKAGRM